MNPDRTTAALFAVKHADGITTKTYNEQSGGGTWILHGSYNFNAGTSNYVETYEPSLTGEINADAVQFVPEQAAPSNLRIVSVGQTSASLAFDYSGSGQTGFYVNRKNSSCSSTTASFSRVNTLPSTALSYNDAALISGSSYCYNIEAYNASGTSAASNNLNVVTPLADTLNPSVAITSPVSGAAVSGTITISANASDNVGVAGVQFLADGVNIGAEDISAPYSISYNTSALTNGTHVISARARDAAGNVATALGVSVGVNNSSSSTITLDNLNPGSSSAQIQFTGSWCVSSAPNFYGANSLYSCGSSTIERYRFTPNISASRRYQVYIRYTSNPDRTTAALFAVKHADGITTKTYNEQSGGGTWILHGSYNFNAGTSNYVETYEPSLTGEINADAVKFVPVP